MASAELSTQTLSNLGLWLFILLPLRILPLLRSLALSLLRTLLITHPLRRGGRYISVGRKGPIDGHAGRASMVDIGKLSPIGGGGTLILHLLRHGRRMRFSQRIQFRGRDR